MLNGDDNQATNCCGDLLRLPTTHIAAFGGGFVWFGLLSLPISFASAWFRATEVAVTDVAWMLALCVSSWTAFLVAFPLYRRATDPLRWTMWSFLYGTSFGATLIPMRIALDLISKLSHGVPNISMELVMMGSFQVVFGAVIILLSPHLVLLIALLLFHATAPPRPPTSADRNLRQP